MSEVASFKSIQGRRSLFESTTVGSTSTGMSRDTSALAEVRRQQYAEQVKSGRVSMKKSHKRERSRSLGNLLESEGGWLPLKMDGYGPSEAERKELAEKKHRRYSALYPAKASQKIVMDKIYLPGAGATRLSLAEDSDDDSSSDSDDDDDTADVLSPLARSAPIGGGGTSSSVYDEDSFKHSNPPELKQSESEEAGGGISTDTIDKEEDDDEKRAEEAEAEDTVREILSMGVSPALIEASLPSKKKSSSIKTGKAKKPGKRRKTLSIDTRSADDMSGTLSSRSSSSSIKKKSKRSSMSGSKTPTAGSSSAASRRLSLGNSTSLSSKPASSSKRLKSRTPRKSTSAVKSGSRVSLSAASATLKKKKRTTTIRPKVGSRYRLDNGDIGICRFYGRTKKARMVGLLIEFGQGDCSGELDGVSYFKCRRNKGRFVTVDQIIEDLGTGTKTLTGAMKRKSVAMKSE